MGAINYIDELSVALGIMMQDMVLFLYNMSWGYVSILVMLFVGSFITVYFRFFVKMVKTAK